MKTYKMKFIDYAVPALSQGKHTVTVTQSVSEPKSQSFCAKEDFYVSGRAYTMDTSEVFSVYPAENECGDLSEMLPFITLEDKYFPWRWEMEKTLDGTPVPWVALIVTASSEGAVEKDISISELLGSVPDKTYFPSAGRLAQASPEKGGDMCHIIDIPIELYNKIMPDFEDMKFLTHVRRINLSDTEDNIAAKSGDFSVVIANRFVPTGKDSALKSTVHLVSLQGMDKKRLKDCSAVRLVSLFRWNVYSLRDDCDVFGNLIEALKNNTGEIGCDCENSVLKRAYVPKKHMTRSGEATYSLYRSPLIPYNNPSLSLGEDCSKSTADGYLIYDPKTGVFDTSYAAAFQLGRLISLSNQPESKRINDFRKERKSEMHNRLLRKSMKPIDVRRLCEDLTKDVTK